MADLISGVGILPITTARPIQGLTPAPLNFPGDSSATYYEGLPVIFTAGLIEPAASPVANTGSLVGFVNGKGVGALTGAFPAGALEVDGSITVMPAVALLVFEGTIDTSAAFGTGTIAVTDMGSSYDLLQDATSKNYYVNKNSTANAIARIVGFKDPVGTVQGRVYFVIAPSKTLLGS